MSSNRKFVLGMLVVPMALLGFAIVYASSVTIPNTFVAGTPAVAAEVNANFAAVKAAVDDNFAKLPQVFAQRDNDFSGPVLLATGQKVMNTINIDLPTSGVLVISGGVFIKNNEAASIQYAMHPRVDSTPISPTPSIGAAYFEAHATNTPGDQFSLNYTVSAAITAGAHTIDHRAGPSSGTADFFHNGEYLTVLFIPNGSVTSVDSP
jgi:hypothetical protein